MNHKEMIIVEYLIDHVVMKAKQFDYDYCLVFQLNNDLYKGKFLKACEHSDSGRCAYKTDSIRGVEIDKDYFKDNDDFSLSSLLTDFADNTLINFSDSALPSFLEHSDVLLSEVIKFVSTINPDDYFRERSIFVPAIYNLENLSTNKKFDYCLVNDEIIKPKHLKFHER